MLQYCNTMKPPLLGKIIQKEHTAVSIWNKPQVTRLKSKSIGLKKKKKRTCKVLQALTGVASLPTSAPPVVLARPRIAEVHLGLTVVAREAQWAATAQAVNGVYGSKQDSVRGNEGRRAVKLQNRDTLHVVLAGLPQADVVVKWKHLEKRGIVCFSASNL